MKMIIHELKMMFFLILFSFALFFIIYLCRSPEGRKKMLEEKKPKKPTSPKNVVVCPFCGSSSIQLTDENLSGLGAIVGGFLFGGLGAVAGALSNNKNMKICLDCDETFY